MAVRTWKATCTHCSDLAGSRTCKIRRNVSLPIMTTVGVAQKAYYMKLYCFHIPYIGESLRDRKHRLSEIAGSGCGTDTTISMWMLLLLSQKAFEA